MTRWLVYHGLFELVFESTRNSSDSSRKQIYNDFFFIYFIMKLYGTGDSAPKCLDLRRMFPSRSVWSNWHCRQCIGHYWWGLNHQNACFLKCQLHKFIEHQYYFYGFALWQLKVFNDLLFKRLCLIAFLLFLSTVFILNKPGQRV